MPHAGTLAACPTPPTASSSTSAASSTTSTCGSATSTPASGSTPPPSRPLGRGPLNEGPGFFQVDELFVSTDGPPTQHLHLAFQTPDRATVDRWHAAVLAAGGRDNGGPGEREYHPGYYAAYALDPDGNNIEAVNHGPATRSVEAVEIRPA